MAYTYFIRQVDSDFLKVGFARDPFSRLLTLQVGNPNKLELVGLKEGNCEAFFHTEFRNQRIQGEWFKIEGRCKDYFDLNQRQLFKAIAICRDTLHASKLKATRYKLRNAKAVLSRLESRVGSP